MPNEALLAAISAAIDQNSTPTPAVDVDALKAEYNALQAGVKGSLSRLITIRKTIGTATGKKWPTRGATFSALTNANSYLTSAKSFAGVPFEENPED